MRRRTQIVGLGLLLLALAACSKAPQQKMAKIPVTRGDLSEIVQATGNIEPLNAVAIIPPVNGRIDKILVYEGSYVKKGQILAWMSTSDRAALLDTVQVEQPDQLEHWETVYKATPIVSPSDGLIVSRNIVEGQTVASSTDVYDLSDLLVVLADVDETDLAKVHNNQLAICSVDAYPNAPFKSKVSLVGHQAIKVNNVVSYQVTLEPVKFMPELRSGMTANINFLISQKKDVLLLPTYVVKGQSETSASVKVAGQDGKPESRQVTLGISDGIHVEVVDGLDEGDQVLVSGLSLPSASAGGPMATNGNMNARPGGGGGNASGGGGGGH